MESWLAVVDWHAASRIVLIALLVGAAWIDVRQHRIPNTLVVIGAVSALFIAHLPGGSVSVWLTGIGVGLAMGLPLYWLRAMGAGDVKLLAMVGAFLGGADMFVATLVIFVVGGVLGLAIAGRRHAFVQLADNLKQMTLQSVLNGMAGASPALGAPVRSVGSQPYGVAIAAGTILYLALARGGVFL